jgi:hypothetical protein
MRHWTAFAGVIANYRLLPESLIAPVAYLLPPAEALLALALAADLGSAWASTTAAALLLVFAVAMSINLRRGRRSIDCGCFQSALKQTLSWRLVVRNIALAALAALAGCAAFIRPEHLTAWATFDGWIAGATLFVLLQALTILWSIVPSWTRPARGGAGLGTVPHAGGRP